MTEHETLSGGCGCGNIRYVLTGEPVVALNCHCRDCQRATGSAYFPAVLVLNSAFELEKGSPRWYESKADAGHKMRRAFCADCGSPVFIENGANDQCTVLYAGSLDDPSRYQPARDIYVKSAQPWDIMHPDLPKDDAMPQRR